MMVTGNHSATTVCRLLGEFLSDHGGSDGSRSHSLSRGSKAGCCSIVRTCLSDCRSDKWNHKCPETAFESISLQVNDHTDRGVGGRQYGSTSEDIERLQG
jgi:hypothetical protein